ncbi:MAG: hypothetical protein AAF993_06455 [Pseudomonadota bacterium]
MLKLAHIVNPLVVTNPQSDLNDAQPITLHTMADARSYAHSTDGLEVDHYAAYFAEDAAAVPTTFTPTPLLDKSMLDVVQGGPTARKLPMLADILQRLYDSATDADYLIYSNIDIGVWPDFYVRIGSLIDQGYDALAIGRRTLSTAFTDLTDLAKIYDQEGTPHFGYSCFVFPRQQYPEYVLGDTCIGLQPVGVTLALNMIQYARRYDFVKRDKLTFHLGDDRVWNASLLDAQHRHNELTLDTVTEKLRHRAPLAPAATRLLAGYQRWRCNYVIEKTRPSLRRNVYRGLRKLRLQRLVAPRYKTC